jgi:hypothetical protein
MLEIYDSEDREMFRGLIVKRSMSTGAVEITSVLLGILQSGYPLPVENTCVSYYHCLERCYVFVGTMNHIKALLVPDCALLNSERLTLRVRSMQESVPKPY